jgi:hypothetical protein
MTAIAFDIPADLRRIVAGLERCTARSGGSSRRATWSCEARTGGRGDVAVLGTHLAPPAAGRIMSRGDRWRFTV